MKAMVFAAGLGTRLGELSKSLPKCLLAVGEKTLLQLTLESLKGAGVEQVVINIHHHPEKIKNYLKQNNNFALKVDLSYEEQPLETGGGLKFVSEHFIKEPHFILHNADVYSEYNLLELINQHKKFNPLATLLVKKRESERGLIFDEDLNILGWDKGDGKIVLTKDINKFVRMPFCGIQVVSPRIFEYMSHFGEKFSIIEVYLQAIKDAQLVKGLISEDYWIDVGTVEKYCKLKEYLKA